MDNQHKRISGYRDLSIKEIDLINEAKALAIKCDSLIDKLDTMRGTDARWLHIGKTDLQKGFMGVIRSIAKPETF